MEKIGCVITVFNRPEYFKQCLKSIESSLNINQQENIQFIIYNDGSTDPEVSKIAKNFKKKFKNTVVVNKKVNLGVNNAIFSGFDTLLNTDAQLFMNLDADAIVSTQWLSEIREILQTVSEKYERFILSTFEGTRNNLSFKNKYKQNYKVSGLNMVFKRNLYVDIRNAVVEEVKEQNRRIYILDRKIKEKYWDGAISSMARPLNITLLTTTPSLSQHIGEEGLNSTKGNYLKSSNFSN